MITATSFQLKYEKCLAYFDEHAHLFIGL